MGQSLSMRIGFETCPRIRESSTRGALPSLNELHVRLFLIFFAPMAIISRRKHGSILSPKRDLVIGTLVALILQIVTP